MFGGRAIAISALLCALLPACHLAATARLRPCVDCRSNACADAGEQRPWCGVGPDPRAVLRALPRRAPGCGTAGVRSRPGESAGYVEKAWCGLLSSVEAEACPGAIALRFGEPGCRVYRDALRSHLYGKVAQSLRREADEWQHQISGGRAGPDEPGPPRPCGDEIKASPRAREAYCAFVDAVRGSACPDAVLAESGPDGCLMYRARWMDLFGRELGRRLTRHESPGSDAGPHPRLPPPGPDPWISI
jgi:hypothetical protein